MKTHLTVLAAALAMTAVLAPAASATIRLDSTTKGGLVITDQQGTTTDHVSLRLINGEWDIELRFKNPLHGQEYDLGPGCRLTSLLQAGAACPRLSGRVTVNLLGGDDEFNAFRVTAGPVTDPLTINMGAGNDRATGGAGDDTINGGSGNDFLSGDSRLVLSTGEDGNDVVRGENGDDLLHLSRGADTADGGLGNDTIFLSTDTRDETDQVNGGVGTDTATYTDPISGRTRKTPLRIIEANLQTLAGEKDTTENDVLNSIEIYEGGDASDIITGVLSSNPSDYIGGALNDQLFGTNGPNVLEGGPGADELKGRDGDDVLDGKRGELGAERDPVIDCGLGIDIAVLDLQDDATPTGCENVEVSPFGEGPHVKAAFGRVVAVGRSGLSVRLRCPRQLRQSCKGTLALRLGGARTTKTAYAIRPGRSQRVAVELGALRGRVGRRTVGQLQSVERGIKGPKTTLMRIVLAS